MKTPPKSKPALEKNDKKYLNLYQKKQAPTSGEKNPMHKSEAEEDEAILEQIPYRGEETLRTRRFRGRDSIEILRWYEEVDVKQAIRLARKAGVKAEREAHGELIINAKDGWIRYSYMEKQLASQRKELVKKLKEGCCCGGVYEIIEELEG